MPADNVSCSQNFSFFKFFDSTCRRMCSVPCTKLFCFFVLFFFLPCFVRGVASTPGLHMVTPFHKQKKKKKRCHTASIVVFDQCSVAPFLTLFCLLVTMGTYIPWRRHSTWPALSPSVELTNQPKNTCSVHNMPCLVVQVCNIHSTYDISRSP